MIGKVWSKQNLESPKYILNFMTGNTRLHPKKTKYYVNKITSSLYEIIYGFLVCAYRII